MVETLTYSNFQAKKTKIRVVEVFESRAEIRIADNENFVGKINDEFYLVLNF